MVKDEFFYACQRGYLATVGEALQGDPTLVCQQVAVAQYLIQKGAHVNAKDRRGETPIQLAHLYNFTSLMTTLDHSLLSNLAVKSDTDLSNVI